MVIISQYIHISNHHIVCLKLTQYCVNYISIKLEKMKTQCFFWENTLVKNKFYIKL